MDPRLVNVLLNDMASEEDQLPLIQHCLMYLWENKVKERLKQGAGEGAPAMEGIHLTLEDYRVVEGVKAALNRHVEEAYKEAEKRQLGEIAGKAFQCLTERNLEQRYIRRRSSVAEMSKIIGCEEKAVIEAMKLFSASGRNFVYVSGQVKTENVAEGPALDNEAEDVERRRCGGAGLTGHSELDMALKWGRVQKPNHAWAERHRLNLTEVTAYPSKSRKRDLPPTKKVGIALCNSRGRLDYWYVVGACKAHNHAL